MYGRVLYGAKSNYSLNSPLEPLEQAIIL